MAAGLAGCGGGPSGSGGTHEDGDGDHAGDDHDLFDHPVRQASVDMVTDDAGEHFLPHAVWVEPGGTVTWVNASGAHSATAYHPDNAGQPRRVPAGSSAWDSGVLTATDAEFEVTFDVPGVYDYYCIPHEAVGMVGTVVVGQEFDAHDQPGLTEPDESLPDRARTDLADLNGIVKSMLGIDDHDA